MLRKFDVKFLEADCNSAEGVPGFVRRSAGRNLVFFPDLRILLTRIFRALVPGCLQIQRNGIALASCWYLTAFKLKFYVPNDCQPCFRHTEMAG